VVETLDSIETTVKWLCENPMPDLLFFDIHLADGNSFKIFQHVKISKPVIFTTAYDEYAIDAFQVNAIDYLLKPVKRPALRKAIEKFKKWNKPAALDYPNLQSMMGDKLLEKRFLIRFGQTMKVVDIKDVAYFYTSDKITFLVTKKGKRYPIDYSLEQLMGMADPRQFFRANRQFIIHTDAIGEMLSHSKSRVKIILDPPCDDDIVVSSERSPLFKKWLVGEG
jgi:two-component system LytT family response regulator